MRFVFNRYCRHSVTNISQCNSINRKTLNKIPDDDRNDDQHKSNRNSVLYGYY